jgi:hypothetical protein
MDPAAIRRWRWHDFVEAQADISRILEERKYRSEDKVPPPELDADGSYADKHYDQIVKMTSDDMIEEIEGDF